MLSGSSVGGFLSYSIFLFVKTDSRTYKTLGPTLFFFLSLNSLVKAQVRLHVMEDEIFPSEMLETEITLGIPNTQV